MVVLTLVIEYSIGSLSIGQANPLFNMIADELIQDDQLDFN